MLAFPMVELQGLYLTGAEGFPVFVEGGAAPVLLLLLPATRIAPLLHGEALEPHALGFPGVVDGPLPPGTLRVVVIAARVIVVVVVGVDGALRALVLGPPVVLLRVGHAADDALRHEALADARGLARRAVIDAPHGLPARGAQEVAHPLDVVQVHVLAEPLHHVLQRHLVGAHAELRGEPPAEPRLAVGQQRDLHHEGEELAVVQPADKSLPLGRRLAPVRRRQLPEVLQFALRDVLGQHAQVAEHPDHLEEAQRPVGPQDVVIGRGALGHLLPRRLDLRVEAEEQAQRTRPRAPQRLLRLPQRRRVALLLQL
mmetsp:Transcript_20956/g.63857  ORF Transcript_20956/g.63857 Transcript_20956/m.63857 type:complete len:313 (-) Transcript_20956:375-1313(-)